MLKQEEALKKTDNLEKYGQNNISKIKQYLKMGEICRQRIKIKNKSKANPY